MGVQESKFAIDVLSQAHLDAVQSRKATIEVEFGKPFIDVLKQLWLHVPEINQKQIISKVYSRSERWRRLPKYFYSPVCRDEQLMQQVPSWTLQPLLFFQDDLGNSFTKNPIGEFGKYMLGLSSRKNTDVVRFRLLQVILHRLRTQKLNQTQRLYSSNRERFFELISKSGIHRDTQGPEQVMNWVDQGEKINGLCEALGSAGPEDYAHLGNLFFLQDISDTRRDFYSTRDFRLLLTAFQNQRITWIR